MGRRIGGLAVAVGTTLLPLVGAAIAGTAAPRFEILDRHVTQIGVDWRIVYRLRYTGPGPLRLSAEDTCLEYAAVLSNARCPAHSFPVSVALELQGTEAMTGTVEVLPGERSGPRCRERVSVKLFAEPHDCTNCRKPPAILQVAAEGDIRRPVIGGETDASTKPPIELEPGDTMSMIVQLEHQHGVCRDRDPLLGPRRFRVHLGPAEVEDAANLDRVLEDARLTLPALTPEASRCDSDMFHSPPNSLHLHDGQPRDASYCFPSVPVQHGGSVSVSFWYCVRPDSDGTCRVRLGEYQDHEKGWTRLGDGFDEILPARGEWTRFERRLAVRNDATTLTLDFRFADGRAGEAWIDDVAIFPVTPLDAGP